MEKTGQSTEDEENTLVCSVIVILRYDDNDDQFMEKQVSEMK